MCNKNKEEGVAGSWPLSVIQAFTRGYTGAFMLVGQQLTRQGSLFWSGQLRTETFAVSLGVAPGGYG